MIITGLDFIVIAVMLISALLAMVRGLTREVLSIVAWVVAAVATYYFFPRFQADVRAQIQPNWLADVALGAGVFLITLIIVSFITMRISDFILDSRIGALDRTLGFIFGLFRGLLLVVIAYIFLAWLVPIENQPPWIRDARSAPILKQTGDAIIALLPEDPEKAILDKLRNHGEGTEEEAVPEGESVPDGDSVPDATDEDPDTTGSVSPSDQSYKPAEKQGMDQLIESTRGTTQ
jgi:membrane protein required for colicin V production